MRKKIISLLTAIITLITAFSTPVMAASAYCYIDGKKQYITSRNVYYNESFISLADEPALVVNGYNYVPAKALIKQLPNIDYSYNSSTKKINITNSKLNSTLVLNLNSTSGTYNGSSITLPMAPIAVRFDPNGDYSVYIPAKDTALYLGLSYTYSNSGKKINYTAMNGSDTTQPDTDVDTDTNDYTFKETFSIARPDSVSKGSISCSDDYHNKRLVITMSGDHSSFYSKNKPSLPSGVSFSYSYNSSTGKTSLIFTTSTINGWRVKETSNKILVMNGKPTDMYKNVIVLDPGHGGSDPGACYGTLYKEADLTLEIVKHAASLFMNNSDYKVYCTRLTAALPNGISKVYDRRTFANNLNADLFLSVHLNSYTNNTANGTETIYNSSNNVSNSGGLSCYKFASIVQSYMLAATGFRDRGVKVDSSLAVLNKNNNPAVLVEVGFISNLSEAQTMAANTDKYGKAIYNAIVEACTDYPTGR